eukprot:2368965-Alexandrium_andersonii.AAC.1
MAHHAARRLRCTHDGRRVPGCLGSGVPSPAAWRRDGGRGPSERHAWPQAAVRRVPGPRNG